MYKTLIKQAAYIIGVMVAALFINTHILMWAFVPSGSMIPTIDKGDLVLGTRYNADSVDRYDVAIFKNPDDESVYYIKRVIGLPGETITIEDGKVYADGKELRDDFVAELSDDSGTYHVPEDSYFMMGDNRNNSKDSRFWKQKYVRKEKLCAKAVFNISKRLQKF